MKFKGKTKNYYYSISCERIIPTGGAPWAISSLVSPCGAVEVAESHFCNAPSSLGRRKYTSSRRSLGEDGSRPVLNTKPDLASRCIHRMQTNRFVFICDS